MIAIINIDKNPRKTGPHDYVLRINRKVICNFVHNREDPLHICLEKAAKAAKAAQMIEYEALVLLIDSGIKMKMKKDKK